MAAKTAREIEDLKVSWLNDPCWDIETTEGFEDHAAELLAWSQTLRAKQEADWKTRQANKKIQTIRTRLYIDDEPTGEDSETIDMLIADGWKPFSVEIVRWIQEYPSQQIVDRYTTLTR